MGWLLGCRQVPFDGLLGFRQVPFDAGSLYDRHNRISKPRACPGSLESQDPEVFHWHEVAACSPAAFTYVLAGCDRVLHPVCLLVQ